MAKITIPQLFTIFLLSTGLNNHVIITPLLLDASGRDAWISIIIGYLATLLISLPIFYISSHFLSESIISWLSTTYSRFVGRMTAIFFSIHLMVAGWISLRETTYWVNETFLFNTPIVIIAICLLSASLYISYGKLNTIAFCAGVLLPLVILFGVFVAIGTIPDKNYQLVTPILVENSWSDVWYGALYVLGSNIEILFIILIQHQISKKVLRRHYILLITFLIILTMGPLLGTIAIFGIEEAKELSYPSFFQWRILGIGTYFNHLDFLSIYQWTSGHLIRLAIFLYLITHVLEIKKKRLRLYIQVFICMIYLTFTISSISDEGFVTFLSNYYYAFSCIVGVTMIIFLTLLVRISKRRALIEK